MDKATLQKLAQDAGLDADLSASILKAMDNPQFSAKLGEVTMTRSDYSRAMDTLRQQEQVLQADQAKWTTWYNTQVQVDSARETALQQYRQRFGELSATQQQQVQQIDPSKYVSKEAYDKGVAEAINRAVQINTSILKDVAWAQDHYRTTFGKPLDLDALEKAALTAGKPLKDAYRDFIQTDLDTKTKTDYDAAIAKAKSEGATEALSKHNLPVDGGKSEGHVLFDALERDKAAQPLSERQRAQGFAEEWNKQGAAA